MSKTFHLPDDVRAELSKIFGESHVPAIETACRRYSGDFGCLNS